MRRRRSTVVEERLAHSRAARRETGRAAEKVISGLRDAAESLRQATASDRRREAE